jgi:hypothetical protein
MPKLGRKRGWLIAGGLALAMTIAVAIALIETKVDSDGYYSWSSQKTANVCADIYDFVAIASNKLAMEVIVTCVVRAPDFIGGLKNDVGVIAGSFVISILLIGAGFIILGVAFAPFVIGTELYRWWRTKIGASPNGGT